jgi:hypothetical protein
MEKRYIVSDSPLGCLLSLACSTGGTIVGGWLSHYLFAEGLDGRAAIFLFLSIMVFFQIPAVIWMRRKQHPVRQNNSRD